MTPLASKSAKVLQTVAIQIALVLVAATLATRLITRGLIGNEPSRIEVAIGVFVICLASAAFIFALYLVNRENVRLKHLPYDLHEINQKYRDALSRVFSIDSPKRPTDPYEILFVERDVLNDVSANIANIFTNLTGRRCVVTVKLLAGKSEDLFCFTWARSHRELLRDETEIEKYSVGSGKNTGFDEALQSDSSHPFFYSQDLIALAESGKYANQRPGWQRVYRSTIVVPIRRITEKHMDVLGFLCVDSMSMNRLNDTYHVQLLAAFADQMYNFLSIMRRRYMLSPGESIEPMLEAREG